MTTRTPPAPILPVPDYEAAVGRSVKGLRIGIPKEYRLDGMPAEIEKIWEQGRAWLKAAGAELVEVSLPHTKYALPAYYIVAPAEASSNLARYDGVRYGLREQGSDIREMYEKTRAAGFGAEVRRRIMIGTYVLSAGYYDAYYLRAQKVRTLIKRDFEQVFDAGVHAILTPATPSAAFGLGEKGGADPVEMYLNDIFTVTVNMAGLPGIAVPAGLDGQGLPLGLQLIGRPFDEETLFATAEVIEQAAGRFTPKRGGEDAMNAKGPPDKLIRGATGDWEVVIGMEVHAQVASNSKLFSGASTEFGAAPNSHVSLVDAAMPGMLPVINEECVARRSAPASASRRRSICARCSTARTTSIPTCRRAIRSASTRRRWWARARSSSIWTAAAASPSASSACIWNRTPARACTTATRPCPTSTSTGRASR